MPPANTAMNARACWLLDDMLDAVQQGVYIAYLASLSLFAK
jgi:hypothetical protein